MINFNKLKKSDYLDRLTKRTYFQPGGKIFNSREEANDYALKLKNQGYVVEPNGDGTFTAKKSTQVNPTTMPGSDIKIDIKSKPGDEDFKINTDKDEFIKQLLKSGWTREDLEDNPGTLPLEDYDKFPSRSKPSEPLVESETFGFKNPTDNVKGIDLPYAIEEGTNTYVTGIENIEKLMRRMSEIGSNKDLTKGTAAFRVNEDGTVDTSKPINVYSKHLVFPAGRETALNNITKQVEQKKMGFKPSGHGAIHENVSDHSLPDKMKQGGTLKDRLLQCGGKMKKAGGTIRGKQHNLPDFLKKEILKDGGRKKKLAAKMQELKEQGYVRPSEKALYEYGLHVVNPETGDRQMMKTDILGYPGKKREMAYGEVFPVAKQSVVKPSFVETRIKPVVEDASNYMSSLQNPNEQNELIIRNHDANYDYKKVGDRWFTTKKGSNNWVDISNNREATSLLQHYVETGEKAKVAKSEPVIIKKENEFPSYLATLVEDGYPGTEVPFDPLPSEFDDLVKNINQANVKQKNKAYIRQDNTPILEQNTNMFARFGRPRSDIKAFKNE